jgi:hypothetical protein
MATDPDIDAVNEIEARHRLAEDLQRRAMKLER